MPEPLASAVRRLARVRAGCCLLVLSSSSLAPGLAGQSTREVEDVKEQGERDGGAALALLREATANRPDDPQAHLRLGLAFAGLGQFANARESVERALELRPGDPEANTAMGKVLTRLGRSSEAIAHFRAVVAAQPGSAEARLDLGIALAESDQLEDALSEFTHAVRLAPEQARGHYNRGRALRDLGRRDQAQAGLTRAIQLDSRLAPALELLATIRREDLRFREAAELLGRVVELQPQNASAHYDLGRLLMDLDRSEEAVQHWERALSIEPGFKEALYQLGHALRDSDPARAAEYQRRFREIGARQQVNDRAGALWNFALAAAAKKDWPRAISLFGQAVEVCGDCAAKGQIHKNFGLIYAQSGDYVGAERALREAARLLPDDAETKRALAVVTASIDGR